MIGALLLIILMAPIGFSFKGEYAQDLNFQGKVTWAGGLISFGINRNEGKNTLILNLAGLKRTIPDKEKKTSPEKKHNSEKRGGKSVGNVLSFINRQMFTAVKALIYKLIKSLHLHLNASGVYGFDDPSLTGMVMSTLAALSIRNSTLALSPDFTGAVLEIRGNFKGWFIPFQILAIVIGFTLKKPVRAIWWPKIKFKKKQKEDVQYA